MKTKAAQWIANPAGLSPEFLAFMQEKLCAEERVDAERSPVKVEAEGQSSSQFSIQSVSEITRQGNKLLPQVETSGHWTSQC